MNKALPVDASLEQAIDKQAHRHWFSWMVGQQTFWVSMAAVLAFVGLTLAGGSGVIIYLFLWVLTPADPLPADTSPSPLEQLVQRLHQAISGALASARRE